VRVGFAFVDGKHSFEEVTAELTLLAARQRAGDVVVVDDMQIAGVRDALEGFGHVYEWMPIWATPSGIVSQRPRAPRVYTVARRIG
jgi:cephalosporin hydroxylase